MEEDVSIHRSSKDDFLPNHGIRLCDVAKGRNFLLNFN